MGPFHCCRLPELLPGLVVLFLISISSRSGTAAEVPLELLDQLAETVQHKSHGIRDEERPAVNRLLLALRTADEPQLKAEAAENLLLKKNSREDKRRPFSQFADLLKDPAGSTGLPLTVHGHVRRLEQIDTLAHEGRDLPVYEAWIFTEDSQGNPWVLLSTEIPSDLKLGTDLNELVEATGYFIKLSTYQAQDARRVTPLIVVSGLHRLIIPSSSTTSDLWLYGGVAFTLLIGCLIAWSNSRAQLKRRRLKRTLELHDVNLHSSDFDSTSSDSGSGP